MIAHMNDASMRAADSNSTSLDRESAHADQERERPTSYSPPNLTIVIEHQSFVMSPVRTADDIDLQRGQQLTLAMLAARQNDQNEESKRDQEDDLETSSTLSSETMAHQQENVCLATTLYGYSESPAGGADRIEEDPSHTAVPSASDTQYLTIARQRLTEYQGSVQAQRPIDNHPVISGQGQIPFGEQELVGVLGPFGLECPFGNAVTRCAYRDAGDSCPFEVPCSLEAYAYGSFNSMGHVDHVEAHDPAWAQVSTEDQGGVQETAAVRSPTRSPISAGDRFGDQGPSTFQGTSEHHSSTRRVDERAFIPINQPSLDTKDVSQTSIQKNTQHVGARAETPGELQDLSGFRALRECRGQSKGDCERSLNKPGSASAETRSASGGRTKRKWSEDNTIAEDFQSLHLEDTEGLSNELTAATQETEHVGQEVARHGWVSHQDRSGQYQSVSLYLGNHHRSLDETNVPRSKKHRKT